ncbi:carbohydrate kinase family protein [bacterium]|nr:carbohydrate kinase family protein [bacterium]
MDNAPTPGRTFDAVGVGRAVYDRALLVEKHPEVDQKTVALDRWQGSGSPVPNALCQLAMWGWRTTLQAGIGGDVEGERIRAELDRIGVHTESLQVRSTALTPSASIWVEKKSGRRTIVLDRDLAPLSPDELSSEAISTARCLLLDGWETEAALEAAKIARDNEVDVVLDAGHVRDRMDDLLAVTDWLIVPVSFTRDYFGNVDMFVATRELLARGPAGAAKGVIITNGAGGSVALARGCDPTWMTAYPVKAVDTTGAGDIFHAGFIHGLLMGWTFDACVRWASAAAALSTTALGARGTLPTREEVLSLLRVHQADGGFEELTA